MSTSKSTAAEPTAASGFALRLPAGLLRIWHPGIGRAALASDRGRRPEPGLTAQLEQALTRTPGIHRLGPGLLAAVPLAGDGDIIDAAVAAGHRFLAELGRHERATGESDEVRVLVYPGRVDVEGSTVRLLPSDLDRLLDQKPPPLPAGCVHLTTRGGLALETPLEVQPGPPLAGPSGEEIPSLRLGRREANRPPWRNVEIWGRRPKWIPDPDLERRLLDLDDVAALRVVGGLGSGKTRAVMATRRVPEAAVHIAVASARSGTAPTALRLLARCIGQLPQREKNLQEQARDLARELSSAGRSAQSDPEAAAKVADMILKIASRRRRGGLPPLTVILDGLERAGAGEWGLVNQLLTAGRGPEAPRLVLVGRNGPWPGAPEGLSAVPVLAVRPCAPDHAQRLLDQLLPGIQLPGAVEKQLLEAAAGNPFALEEGVLSLIQHRMVRRFYGAFVFRGEPDTAFRPTLRLLAQIEAEGRRLGDTFPARLLAVCGEAAPPREVASAAALHGHKTVADWERPFLEAGWLASAESPWGLAVGLAWGAAAAAWRETVPSTEQPKLRRTLGELLAEVGTGEGHWRAYRLLAGDPEAIPLLLRTTELPGGPRELAAPARELVDALQAELEHHRSRDGDEETELRLLWRLMPLARHTGQLSNLRQDLERALVLAESNPRRIVALSLLKAELDHDEGHFHQAEQTLRTALEKSSAASEPQKAVLLVQLGHLLMRQERNPEARKLFERILPTLDGAGLKSLTATCRFHLGNIALAENRLDDALEQHLAALEPRRHARAPKALSASLAALGSVSLACGHYPQALAYYQEAEQVARETDDDGETAFALRGVGGALSRLGDFTSATVPLRRALELREKGDDVIGKALARLEVAENYLHLNNPGEALAEARKALFELSLHGRSAALGEAERLLGRIQMQRRRQEEARRHLRAALELHEALGDPLEAAFDRANLIRTERMSGEPTGEQLAELAALVRALADFLETHHYPELGERLDLAMFLGLERLATSPAGTRPRLFYLKRAYATLMRKTAHLPSELRSRFLFRIPDNESIQTAAAGEGLAIAGASTAEPGSRG